MRGQSLFHGGVDFRLDMVRVADAIGVQLVAPFPAPWTEHVSGVQHLATLSCRQSIVAFGPEPATDIETLVDSV